MRFGISTQIQRGSTVTLDLLESIRKAGYERFELFCNRPHLDFHSRSLMRSIGRWFRENALPAPSIHLPFIEGGGAEEKIWISALSSDRKERAYAIDEIKRALELTDYVAPSYVVMHLGNPNDKFTPVAFEYAYAVIAQIRTFAGVKIMVENIPNEISTIDRIQEFKTVAEVTDIGICYDTGHGHLQQDGTKAGSFDAIDTTHIHDNRGDKDDHLWPFEGTINWPALIEKLVLAQYRGEFIFETRSNDLGKGDEVRSRLEDLWHEAQSSLEEFRLKYNL
jgi:sugar phosphate isomerase/epimerase